MLKLVESDSDRRVKLGDAIRPSDLDGARASALNDLSCIATSVNSVLSKQLLEPSVVSLEAVVLKHGIFELRLECLNSQFVVFGVNG